MTEVIYKNISITENLAKEILTSLQKLHNQENEQQEGI